MNQRFIFSFFAIILSLQPVFSQKLANSVFWEVSGNGLKQPSYIFGTHHLYNPESVKANQLVTQKLNASEQIVGEIVVDMTAMLEVMKAAMLTGDTTLQSLLTPEQFKKLDNYFQQNVGFSVKLFNKMKPMILYQMITVQKYAKVAGSEENSMDMNDLAGGGMLGGSLDGYFQQYAKEKDKEVGGLETVAQQASFLFDGYPLDTQVEMLMKALDEEGRESKEDFEKLNQFYKEQDLNGIADYMLTQMSEQEYNLMLKNRNDAWIPQMHQMMQTMPTFFAVGAAHLVGKDGVILQLRKMGYDIKPITIKI